jgi:serine/threonine protein phosphatase 1
MPTRVDRDRFAAFNGARRVWAVGAIHGEATRLAALHAELGERFLEGDRLVYLGNYMGHGPAILETINELLLFRRQLIAAPGMHVCDVAYLRGQQEEMWHKLLQLHLAVGPAEVLTWMLDRGLRQTLEAYGSDEETALRRARSGALDLARWTNELRQYMQARDGHVQLMSSLRRAAFTEDGMLLFVHTGIDAKRPLDAQGDAFWWNGADFAGLDAPFSGYTKIVRGFDVEHGGVQIGPFSATVDSGCGFGGTLSAICFGVDGEEVDRVEV